MVARAPETDAVFRLVQPRKASVPMEVTFFRSMEVMAVLRNA